ncbi:MAG: methanol dehydrogenase [Labilithrix sp.]|nr:methanol dehydrogenase [Labilithrix sp.]
MRTLAWISFLFALIGGVLLVSGDAAAFTPPSPQGAVTDTSGHLSAEDDRVLEAHISAYRARTTHELAVLMVGSLNGESIDDVAYTTFNTWGVGKKGAANGVLLVIAPAERKMRIETGKGIGDRLTDLESNRILRERVGPQLKRENFVAAVLAGLEGIEAALDRDGPAPASSPKAPLTKPAHDSSWLVFLLPLLVLGLAFAVVVWIIVAIVRRVVGGGPRYGGSYSSNDSYSSSNDYSSSSSCSSGSSGSSDWSSGGGGGSDFGGGSGGSDFGGGSSGGGGSSDSY